MAGIVLDNVHLEYPVFDARQRKLSSKLKIISRIGSEVVSDRRKTTVHALKDVSLKIDAGDRVGIIGHNGAGKSTLLRVIAGIYSPQYGYIDVDGHVTALMNLSLGMDKSATGFENIVLLGLVYGFSMDTIESRVEQIVEFSELQDFIHLPVRSYSQGMTMRLAFAIATSGSPDILLLDEWIGAGDAGFLSKVQQRMKALVDTSNILVLATHRTALTEQFCNKVILMNRGSVQFFGPMEQGLNLYQNKETIQGNPEPYSAT